MPTNQQPQRSAAYVPEARGVVTSDGRFYPTSNRNWLPSGTEAGFADVRKDNLVIVIPKSAANSGTAKSTKEGVTYSIPSKPSSSSSGPQTKSQAAQDQQRSLIRQNVDAAREANQREQNYSTLTKLPYQTKGTEIKSAPSFNSDMPISLFPSVYQRQTGSFIDQDTGKTIPLIETRYNEGIAASKDLIVKDRAATKDERDYFIQQKEVLMPSKPDTFLSAPIRQAKETYGSVSQVFYSANKNANEFFSSIGASDENIGKAADILAYGLPTSWIPGGKKVTSGFIAGVAKEVTNRPFSNALAFGAGAGVGYIAEGLPILARGTFNLLSLPKAAVISEKALKIGTVSIGTGLGITYAGKTGIDVISAPDSKTSGEILGGAVFEAAAFGFGAGKGAKLARTTEGFISTLGRKELVTQQGIYPSAPTSKQLDLFKKNVIPELSDKPGAFHTTSNKFFDNSLTPKSGTSELSGVYASTQVSTPFLRLSGSGAKESFNIKSIFNTGKPAIAYLVPKGFREVDVGFSGKPSFEGQKFIKGRGFAFFKQKAEPGFMDIPGIKTEIEAIARPEAGSFKVDNKNFYTKVNGVRVPIDTFVPDVKIDIKVDMKGSRGSKTSPSSYSISSISSRSIVSDFSIIPLSSKSSSSIYSSLSLPSSSKSISSYNSYSIGPSSFSLPSSKSFGSSSFGPSSFVSSMIDLDSYVPSYSKKSYSSVVPSTPSFGFEFGENKKKKGRKNSYLDIKPSFTAIVADIKMKDTLKVSKTFGVTPMQIRGLLPRKSKKKYYKLTDL